MKNQIVEIETQEIMVARFGAAALVKTKEGRFALRGGSRSDHIEARDWASMFLHEAVLVRTEKERDEARKSVSEGVRQVQDMEKNLLEASSLLSGWKTRKSSNGSRTGKDSFQVARGGLGVTAEK